VRTFRLILLVLASIIVPAAQGRAQTCVGRSSFKYGTVGFGGTGTVTGGSRGFGAYGSYGRPTSWYAGATIGTTLIDGGGGTSLNLGASLGYQLPIGRSSFEFCPYAIVGSSALRNVSTVTGTGITTRTNSYGFGGTFGWRYEDSDELDIVPALGVQWQSQSVSSPDFRSGPNSSGSASFSLGFVADRQWSIVPGVSSSFSTGSTYVYTLSVGYSFGR
jgi:hypothetical protein